MVYRALGTQYTLNTKKLAITNDKVRLPFY